MRRKILNVIVIVALLSLAIVTSDCSSNKSAESIGTPALCDPSVGLTSPISLCTEQNPCVNLLEIYTLKGITKLTSPSDAPMCKAVFPTTQKVFGCYRGGRGDFDDGSPHFWNDQDGANRSWCEFRPAGTSTSSKRPLLIYIPGSGGSAGDIYDYTLLRAKAGSFALSGDLDRPGFILVSSQGRNLHWPTANPEEGSKYDSYHRNLATNRDVAFLDHLIDSFIAEGVVDPKRIYLTGWSNGARFASFYGIYRHEKPTPEGNRVAAVAVYSNGDPFENITKDQVPSCKQDPYPLSALPYLLVSRNCDGVACNQEQYDAFLAAGWIMTPGNQAEGWINTLNTLVKDPNAQWTRIGYYGSLVNACMAATECTQAIALRNHLCWPDGISDEGGIDREPEMLNFLRDHPLL